MRVEARVGDTTLLLLLDTGAQISVFPVEVVPEAVRTGEQVRVEGYSGNSELRELAKVEIVLGEKVLHEKVALASMRELDGKGLLALNLRRKDAGTF